MNFFHLSWQEYDLLANRVRIQLAAKLHGGNQRLFGIPRGGLPLAVQLAYALDLPLALSFSDIDENTILVDDIADSGKTLKKYYKEYGSLTTAVLLKRKTYHQPGLIYGGEIGPDIWVIFPWNNSTLEKAQKDYEAYLRKQS